MRIVSIISLIFLFSCGGGASVGSGQEDIQPDSITYKNVPQNISIFE